MSNSVYSCQSSWESVNPGCSGYSGCSGCPGVARHPPEPHMEWARYVDAPCLQPPRCQSPRCQSRRCQSRPIAEHRQCWSQISVKLRTGLMGLHEKSCRPFNCSSQREKRKEKRADLNLYLHNIFKNVRQGKAVQKRKHTNK